MGDLRVNNNIFGFNLLIYKYKKKTQKTSIIFVLFQEVAYLLYIPIFTSTDSSSEEL